MKRNLILIVAVVTALAAVGYFRWKEAVQENALECRAKLHSRMAANTCQGISVFDIFLSIHGDGAGYFIVLGTYTCPNAPPKLVNSTVEFTYKKEGNYYAMNLEKRSPELPKLFNVLKYDEIKLKITRLSTSEYLLNLPFEPPMVCKRD